MNSHQYIVKLLNKKREVKAPAPSSSKEEEVKVVEEEKPKEEVKVVFKSKFEMLFPNKKVVSSE
jgi:hypothetical protein